MFESISDRMIREAMERGEFDDLPGAGKPIPGAGRPYDANWWVRSLIERERADDERRARYERLEMRIGVLMSANSEAAVRTAVGRINGEIAELNAESPTRFEGFDVEDVVTAWKAVHRASVKPPREPRRPPGL